jgi:hypothetical protein
VAEVLTTLTPEKPKWYPRFLASLGQYGNVSRACKSARISRETAYTYRHNDPELAAAWAAALELGVDALEDEAKRRAYEGVKKPVFQGKELVGHVQEYSDTLLIFLLKAHKPSVYRETMQHLNLDLSTLTDEQIARIANGEDPLKVVGAK